MQKHEKIKNKKIGRLGGVHLAGAPCAWVGVGGCL